MSLGERLGKISDRLGVRQPHQAKPARLETIDNRIRQLEDRFLHVAENYNKKVATLKGQVLKLTKIIEEDNRTYANQSQARIKELEALDSKVNRKLEHEILQRKQGENRVLAVLEQRIEQLKHDVEVEGEERQHMIQNVTHNLETELPSLMELIKTQSIERQNTDNETLETAVNQIRNLNEVIETQKRLREQSENNTLELIKQLVAKVKKQIEDQKRARQTSHDSILSLVQQACNKISFHNYT